MEEAISFFGGEIEGEKVKDKCCGGGRFFAGKWATEKLSMLILEKSAGTLVVFCPLCHMALTTFARGQESNLPDGPFALRDGRERQDMNVVIVGGGISGISAAKVILKEGHKRRRGRSGGRPRRPHGAHCQLPGRLQGVPRRDKRHPGLTVISGARIVSAQRRNGGFSLILSDGRAIDADKVVVATGLSPYDPVAYKGPKVLTSLEYDALIDQRNGELPADFNRIAFVMCVGSRCEEYPLCSSVCCSYTIREIKWTLQRANPAITVFYNDLRLFGSEFFMEKIYRDGGVRFVRANSRYFEADGDEVRLRYFSAGKLEEEAFDYVVMAIGLRPNPTLADVAGVLGFSLNESGFVGEKGALATDAEGVYACGGAFEPMNIKDSILTGFGAGLQPSMMQQKGQAATASCLRHPTQGFTGKSRRRFPSPTVLSIPAFLPGHGRPGNADVLRILLV